MGQDREDVGRHGRREAAPLKSTAAVEAAPPKPAEAAAPPPVAPEVAPSAPPGTASADPKAHMLANEKAEAERSAALQQKAATPAPRETKRYFKVKVLDAGTLEAGPPTEAVVIRLEGIDTLRSRRDLQDEERQDMALRREGAGGADPLHPLARRDLHGAARARRAMISLPVAASWTRTFPPGSCAAAGQRRKGAAKWSLPRRSTPPRPRSSGFGRRSSRLHCDDSVINRG